MNQVIQSWCDRNRHVVMYDEGLLLDVYSGRSLRLPAIADAVEKTAADTGEQYVVILFEDGRQLALSSVGIAWPPDQHNLPRPLALPPVVCWRDYANVSAQIQHVIEHHRDTAPSREVVDMLVYCIALLDGARAAGFDIGAEEQRIEGYLDAVEKLGGAV